VPEKRRLKFGPTRRLAERTHQRQRAQPEADIRQRGAERAEASATEQAARGRRCGRADAAQRTSSRQFTSRDRGTEQRAADARQGRRRLVDAAQPRRRCQLGGRGDDAGHLAQIEPEAAAGLELR
jgi:hypothetical protein